MYIPSDVLWMRLDGNLALIKCQAIADYRTGWRIEATSGMVCDCANDDQRAGWWARRQNMSSLVGSWAIEAVDEFGRIAEALVVGRLS